MAKILNGITVEQLIEQLQKLPPKTLVVGEVGEGTVMPIKEVKLGFVYKYTEKETYGGSQYLFNPDDDYPKYKKQEAVFIGG